MTFNGLYYDGKWWTGSASLTRQFNFASPVNVFAFGALTAVQVSGGAGCAYVGIMQMQALDPATGRYINVNTMIPGQYFPAQSILNQNVKSITFLFGSKTPPGSQIAYANANLNIFLWS